MKFKALLVTFLLSISLSVVYAEQVGAYEQNTLGNKYRDGRGVEQSYKQAVYWYKKSALQGNDKAQNNLGNRYRYGQGVERSYKQAVYWYKKSALQGNDKAQNNLGNRYRKSQGVEKNYKQAVFWYKKSSLQGNDKAQNNLGNMYRKGRGVERDMNKAAFWIKKAKEQGNHSATKNWSKHKLWKYENRGEGSNTQAIPTIKEAIKDYEAKNYKFAFAKFYAFAKAGNPIAQWYLGMMYITGKGVKEDKKKGFEWMSKSAEQGDADAQYVLGVMYMDGEAVKKDEKKGIEWIIKAGKQGQKEAKEFLDELRKEKESLICRGGVGTGFVVSQDGVIATAEHVVTASTDKGVKCECKKIEIDGMKASIITRDAKNDTALVKVNKVYEDVSSVSFRDLKSAEDVIVFGYPFGDWTFAEISTTKGSISGEGGIKNNMAKFRFDAAIQGGNSGGPIVSIRDGKVLGLVSSSYIGLNDIDRMDVQNLNFGIHTSILRRMMSSREIPITSKRIPQENSMSPEGRKDAIVRHYKKTTKYIECIN